MMATAGALAAAKASILSGKGWVGRLMPARAARDAGGTGPLAGLPYFAKDLFDIEGEPTVAASPPRFRTRAAMRDATLVARLRAAGAVLLGTSNMDALAYGFATSTACYGIALNPHDPSRLCGGSSGGSAALVAAGVVPFALGSDTNGSIRVPAALCGVWGLKPTYGRLSRTGCWPLSHDLDHTGLLARDLDMLERVFAVLDGFDATDPASAAAPDLPAVRPRRPRVALAGGYFNQCLEPAVTLALTDTARRLNALGLIDLPLAAEARAAAYVLTAAQGACVNRAELTDDYASMDPACRARLAAGLGVPYEWVDRAQRLRRHYARRLTSIFADIDIILAPAVPCLAPPIDQQEMRLGDTVLPMRAALGLFTQPISFAGLPVLTVPVDTVGGLPTGMQLIAAPWREDLLFAAARLLL